MALPKPPPGSRGLALVLLAGALVLGAALPGAVVLGQPSKIDILRIGTSGAFGVTSDPKKEEAALETLKGFIKEETGLGNEIVQEKDWDALTAKLNKGEVQFGLYQGYEFAWAQEKHPDLKPLALAVNIHRYPIAHVVTNVNNKAKDFTGLQGQTLAPPAGGLRLVRLFVERQAQKAGKSMDAFFGKVTRPENLEDALDDAVDGVVQVVAVDRAALEAFKQRKPARFKKLKEVAHSQPFPPALVTYYGKHLDEATRARFRMGLLESNRKEKGKQMLELFGLTHFDPLPKDFAKVVADTRKNYPPDTGK